MTEALPFGRSLLARSFPAIALGGLLAAASHADAATYYVAPTGSDASSCSSTAPCRQIRRGLALAGPGDTVLVADGDYLGFDVRDRDGSAASPITIRAAGTNARVLKTTDRSDNRDTIFVTYSSYVVIDGLRAFSANRAAVRVDASQHITIRNGVFGANATWGIFTDFSDDLLIENNECYGSVSQHGIYISNSGDRPVVRGNRVHDNRDSGIQLNADVTMGGDGLITGALIEKNVIYNNGAGGGGAINLDGVQSSTVRNNLLYNNHATGIVNYVNFGAAGPKGMEILNNTVYQAADGRWAVIVWKTAGTNRIRNNVLYHPSTARGSIDYLTAADVTNTDSDYNVITNVTPNDATVVTLAQWKAQGHEPHSMTATPAALFMNPATYDLRLRTGSPAIDRGAAVTTVTADIRGAARPSGAAWDVGAYEGASAATTRRAGRRLDGRRRCDGERRHPVEDGSGRVGQLRRDLDPADLVRQRLRRGDGDRRRHAAFHVRPVPRELQRGIHGHRLRDLPAGRLPPRLRERDVSDRRTGIRRRRQAASQRDERRRQVLPQRRGVLHVEEGRGLPALARRGDLHAGIPPRKRDHLGSLAARQDLGLAVSRSYCRPAAKRRGPVVPGGLGAALGARRFRHFAACGTLDRMLARVRRSTRNAHLWLPGYLADRWRRRSEPPSAYASGSRSPTTSSRCGSARRPDGSASAWPLADGSGRRSPARHRDARGRPPQYCFFYPEEEYRPELLEPARRDDRDGIGDVEVHLHHDDDTERGVHETGDALHRDAARALTGSCRRHDGQLAFGFIHGNWALDNARPDGRWCGDQRRDRAAARPRLLRRLHDAGGSRPLAGGPVNAIYRVTDDPVRPRSYETGGSVVGPGTPAVGDLTLIPGPLGVSWRPNGRLEAAARHRVSWLRTRCRRRPARGCGSRSHRGSATMPS